VERSRNERECRFESATAGQEAPGDVGQRKPSARIPRTEMRQRMHEIARTRVRYGYRRLQVLLRWEGIFSLGAGFFCERLKDRDAFCLENAFQLLFSLLCQPGGPFGHHPADSLRLVRASVSCFIYSEKQISEDPP
jgi:hypothetical protein